MTEPTTTRSRLPILLGVIVLLILLTAAVAARFFRIPKDVAYVSEEEGAISVIDLDTLAVVNRIHPADLAPRGLNITFDGKYLVTANKNTSDVAVFDTRRLRLVRRIHVGENPEFVKIDPSGHWLFTSYEPGSTGGPPTQEGATPGASSGAQKGKEDENEGVPSKTTSWGRRLWKVSNQTTSNASSPPSHKACARTTSTDRCARSPANSNRKRCAPSRTFTAVVQTQN